jgi:hypothetical protein
LVSTRFACTKFSADALFAPGPSTLPKLSEGILAGRLSNCKHNSEQNVGCSASTFSRRRGCEVVEHGVRTKRRCSQSTLRLNKICRVGHASRGERELGRPQKFNGARRFASRIGPPSSGVAPWWADEKLDPRDFDRPVSPCTLFRPNFAWPTLRSPGLRPRLAQRRANGSRASAGDLLRRRR